MDAPPNAVPTDDDNNAAVADVSDKDGDEDVEDKRVLCGGVDDKWETDETEETNGWEDMEREWEGAEGGWEDVASGWESADSGWEDVGSCWESG